VVSWEGKNASRIHDGLAYGVVKHEAILCALDEREVSQLVEQSVVARPS
jgi:hypothetical protein